MSGGNPIKTNPYVVTMATTDELPYGIDMTGALTNIAGGSVSGAASSLVDLGTRQSISLGSPVTVGNVVTQSVLGSALIAGHNYLLRITFTAATGTIVTVETEIDCLS